MAKLSELENKLVWKSEAEQQKQFQKQKASWKPGLSRDGFVIAAEGIFRYKGIAYLVKVLNYFNFNQGFIPMFSLRASGMHAVVEYPKESKWLVEIVKKTNGDSDFLYHDTLHTYNISMTIEEQIAECHRIAKLDIDTVFSLEFKEILKKKHKNIILKKLSKIAYDNFVDFI